MTYVTGCSRCTLSWICIRICTRPTSVYVRYILNAFYVFYLIFYKLREKLPITKCWKIFIMLLCTLISCMALKFMPILSLDKLIKLNNKLLRILQNRLITTPTCICQLYKSYNTLLIPDIHKQQLLHFVYKNVHHPALLP